MANSEILHPVLWQILKFYTLLYGKFLKKNPVCLTHGACQYIRVDPPGLYLQFHFGRMHVVFTTNNENSFQLNLARKTKNENEYDLEVNILK